MASSDIQLKKEIGLADAVALIVGSMIGSGIFITPVGVLQSVGSVGMALVIWVAAGLLSFLGAFSYAELGTTIPLSGGDYTYLRQGFGPLPAFLFMWIVLIAAAPISQAIHALTFAQYSLQPLWPQSNPPAEVLRLVAALVACFTTALNCYNVKLVTKVQGVFSSAKVLALVVIIIAGLHVLSSGEVGSLRHPMAGTSMDARKFAIGIYQGLYSYSGWYCLNIVTEELRDPFRNLPRAISISLPLVTLIYMLTNVAYFVALTQTELLTSSAVAVTFGAKVLGVMAWTMPLFVACSMFGSLNGSTFVHSRLLFAGAREGHLPAALSFINITHFTPLPSLILLCVLSLIFLYTDDVHVLITYCSAMDSLFKMMSVCGLLWLRHSQPHLYRPIKINVVVHVLYILCLVFLVALPLIVKPMEVIAGLALVLSGVPVYFIFVRWQKPTWLTSFSDSFNLTCAKCFGSLPETKVE